MAEMTANNLYWLASKLNYLMETEEALGEMANPVFYFTTEMGGGHFDLNIDYDTIYTTEDPNGPPMNEVLDEAIEALQDRVDALNYALSALRFLRQGT